MSEERILDPPANEIKKIRTKILKWFKENGRSYPWRETDEPFKLLIAELMLRRTKADQVVPVYQTFIEKYPDPISLMESNLDEVSNILYPLGLHWRISNFLLLAKELIENYRGVVPQTREELKTLPGVGDYVAGATLSIAKNKKEWIVDSNIVRFYKRYFGIKTSKEGRRDKYIISLAKLYSSCRNPREANLALLDFTALICTHYKPDHENCILNKYCYFIKK